MSSIYINIYIATKIGLRDPGTFSRKNLRRDPVPNRGEKNYLNLKFSKLNSYIKTNFGKKKLEGVKKSCNSGCPDLVV